MENKNGNALMEMKIENRFAVAIASFLNSIIVLEDLNICYFHVRETPTPLNIATPTPAPEG